MDAAGATLRRFPLVMLAATVSAVAAVLLAEDIGSGKLWERVLAASTLGIPLLTAATLLGERRRGAVLSAPRGALLAGALVVLVGIALLWPTWFGRVQALRYTQLSVAFHLLVAFLPFAGRDEDAGFWQFNRGLFTRFLAAGISSATLYGGLALALLALDKLFGVDVPNEGYFRLWVCAAFVFNTWYFLGGVTRDLDGLGARTDYPPALKVFSQYILMPLVALYLVILTLYLAKVLVTWDWPSGWIGWLVSGVATAGIFALLLVHPIAEQPEQKWVRAFARDFWVAILPATVMLWLALYQRLAQYGMTEPRYFLMVLSVWLFGAALYYRFQPDAPILRIPASLCVVALITFSGPWSAYKVSERSQVARLEELLTENRVLAGGRADSARGAALAPLAAKEVSAIVTYVIENYGARRLGALVPDSLATQLREDLSVETKTRMVVAAWGVRYRDRWQSATAPDEFSVEARGRPPVNIAGYDLMVTIDVSYEAGDYTAQLAEDRKSLTVFHGDTALSVIPLAPLIERFNARRARVDRRTSITFPADSLLVDFDSGGVRARAILRTASGIYGDSSTVVTNVTGVVLLRRGRPRN